MPECLHISRKVCIFAEKKRDMFIFDPIAMLIVVAGVFAYFAFKGVGSANRKEMSNEDFIKWFAEQEAKRSKDNVRYQNWLYDHRQ